MDCGSGLRCWVACRAGRYTAEEFDDAVIDWTNAEDRTDSPGEHAGGTTVPGTQAACLRSGLLFPLGGIATMLFAGCSVMAGVAGV